MPGRLGMKPPLIDGFGNIGRLGWVSRHGEVLGGRRNEVSIPTAAHCFSTSNTDGL